MSYELHVYRRTWNSCIHTYILIFQAAESGNLDDFNRLFIAEPARLDVRDSKGRAAVHQAAARNKLNILQFIRNHGGGKFHEARSTVVKIDDAKNGVFEIIS